MLDYMSKVFCPSNDVSWITCPGFLARTPGFLARLTELNDFSRVSRPKLILGWMTCPGFPYAELIVQGFLRK